MDTLALLCNLHADGPLTLQRLRRSGCDTLLALRRVDAARLSDWLGWNERAAERFLREAALLSERVEPELTRVGSERVGSEPAFELESNLGEEFGDAAREGEGEDEQEDEEGDDLEREEDGAVEEREEPSAHGVGAVLGAWRELDRVSPPGDPQEFLIPRPPPRADRRLEGVRLEGLDAALRARLVQHGVNTLRELCESPAVETARALRLAYTRLARLQFLARGELERLSAAAVEAEPPSRPAFTPFDLPPNKPFETAGPFA